MYVLMLNVHRIKMSTDKSRYGFFTNFKVCAHNYYHRLNECVWLMQFLFTAHTHNCNDTGDFRTFYSNYALRKSTPISCASEKFSLVLNCNSFVRSLFSLARSHSTVMCCFDGKIFTYSFFV